MIADALFCLLKRKPFAQITVTEICEEAAIGRKTFYRNFELREDVIEFQLDNMCVEYRQEIAGMSLEECLYHHFDYVKRNKDYFIVLYRNGFDMMVHEKVAIAIPDVMPVWTENTIEQEYRSAYITAGIEAILRVWITRGCKESIERVVEYAMRAQDKQVPMIEV
jgi:AcrR family transcriptional regulator